MSTCPLGLVVRHARAVAPRIPQSVAAISRIALIAALAAPAWAPDLRAQDAAPAKHTELPPVVIEQPATPEKPKAVARAKGQAAKSAPVVVSDANEGSGVSDAQGEASSSAGALPQPGTRSGSLGIPTTAEATAEIRRIPGAVDVVPDTAYKPSTPSATIKDALDYVPGVFVQTKWGEDSRLSIRGSGLSRNYHLRSLQLFMDGIPINTADGYGDFQEIDPTAYRYIEVFRGANALRFGANSLGGAINFVMPSGYDADLFGGRVDLGSFGFHKVAASSGGVYGPVDYFITGTWQEQEGFREHSNGESVRGSMNIGYRLTENAETRFYLNANTIDQRIPGSLIKEVALTAPETAAPANVADDWQRNIDSLRVANRTTFRLAPTTLLEVGAFGADRHLMHPIFEWLDYDYEDYGAYSRFMGDYRVAGYRNRLVAGVTLLNGTIDARQYVNIGGDKGALTFSAEQKSENLAAYAENSFFVLPTVALVAGTQFLHAERKQKDRFFADPPAFGFPDPNPDDSGRNVFDLWSPKIGVLWDVTPYAQVFANISRSAEVPSFGENDYTAPANFNVEAQQATTYEIGTRGQTPDLSWDIALYRANIDNELQCISPFPVNNFCIVQNADNTIHQGVEFGVGAALYKGLFVDGTSPDKIWLNAAYAFSDFRFDGDPVFGDNELPGAPRHYLRAELLYKHPSGVYVGPNVEWVPEAYYVDNANTLDTEPYAIWGAKIGYDAGGTITAYLEGRNLSDEKYIASTGVVNFGDPATTAMFDPGNGRAIYGGVQVKW